MLIGNSISSLIQLSGLLYRYCKLIGRIFMKRQLCSLARPIESKYFAIHLCLLQEVWVLLINIF